MAIQNYIPTGHLWDNTLSILNAWMRLGYLPNVRKPRTFNEYILAQKWSFEGDLTLARRVTDKADLKNWLAEIGMHHLSTPTLGVFDSVEELRDARFEGEIIAKSTHGSGATIIHAAFGNNPFSYEDFRQMRGWLAEDYYLRSREPNYKGLPRRIIVEPLLRDQNGEPPKDFKIFCAGGVPFMIQVDHDRFIQHTRQLYTTDWCLLEYSMCYPRLEQVMPKPVLLDNALNVAKTLATGFGLVRVDFYFMADGLKLGEMTFFPGNGAEQIQPKEGDAQLGQVLRSCARV